MLVSSLPYGVAAAALAGLLIGLLHIVRVTDPSGFGAGESFHQRSRWAAALTPLLYLLLDVLGKDVIPAGAHRLAIDLCAFIVVPGVTALLLMPTMLVGHPWLWRQ
jgi:hypothetical protein